MGQSQKAHKSRTRATEARNRKSIKKTRTSSSYFFHWGTTCPNSCWSATSNRTNTATWQTKPPHIAFTISMTTSDIHQWSIGGICLPRPASVVPDLLTSTELDSRAQLNLPVPAHDPNLTMASVCHDRTLPSSSETVVLALSSRKLTPFWSPKVGP